jgi:FG-GAP-like repeat/RTX calcium-binding nonapeptide repeat (4 copies)
LIIRPIRQSCRQIPGNRGRAVVEGLEKRRLLAAATFASQTNYAVGGVPHATAVVDLNGDGYSDVVTANDNGTVTVLLGNYGGTLGTPATFSDGLANGFVMLGVADLNFDGQPDLVVGNFSQVSVLLGNGDGTFLPPQITNLPAGTDVGTLADINGDGSPDLVVGDIYGNVSVLLSNGYGGFSSPQTINIGSSAVTGLAAIEVGPYTDVVAVEGDSVMLLPNNGYGALQSSTTILTVPGQTAFVTVGDFNYDGYSDVAAAGSDGSLTVALGNYAGTFQVLPAVPLGFTPTSYGQTADLDGDGNPDLVFADGTNQLEMLSGNGDGTFAPAQPVEAANDVYFVAVGDINGDGRPDLVTTDNTDAQIGLLLNNTSFNPTFYYSYGVVESNGSGFADKCSIYYSYTYNQVVLDIDGDKKMFAMNSESGFNFNLGAGNDSLDIGNGMTAVTTNGGTGNDTLSGETSGDMLMGAAGNDMIIAGDASSSVAGASTSDLIAMAERGALETNGAPNVTVAGGAGDDTLLGGATGGDMLKGGKGDDLFLDAGSAAGDTITGGVGLNFALNDPQDSVTGLFQLIDPPKSAVPAVAPAAVVSPLQSDDVSVELDSGVLTIVGTPGDDTISITSADQQLTVAVDGAADGTFPVTQVTGISIAGKAGDDVLKVDASVSLPATLKGGGGNDSLQGGGGDNVLVGADGNDTLNGGGGTNLLVPGALLTYTDGPTGNDSLVGGSGFNIADFAYRTDPLTLSNNGQPTSGGVGETTTIAPSVQAIWGGTGDDTITGATGGEFLSGGAGADSITGGGVNDLIVGGKGEDTVVVTAEPVTLYLRDGKPDDYSGVNDPTEDILILDPNLDVMT